MKKLFIVLLAVIPTLSFGQIITNKPAGSLATWLKTELEAGIPVSIAADTTTFDITGLERARFIANRVGNYTYSSRIYATNTPNAGLYVTNSRNGTINRVEVDTMKTRLVAYSTTASTELAFYQDSLTLQMTSDTPQVGEVLGVHSVDGITANLKYINPSLFPAYEIPFGTGTGLTSNYAFRYNSGGNLALTTLDTSQAVYKTVLPFIYWRAYFDSRSDDIVRIGGFYTGDGTAEKGTLAISTSEIAGSVNHYLTFDHFGRLGVNTNFPISSLPSDTVSAMMEIRQYPLLSYLRAISSSGAEIYKIDSIGSIYTTNHQYLNNAKRIYWKRADGVYSENLRLDSGNSFAIQSGGGGIKFEKYGGSVGWRMMDDTTSNFVMTSSGNIQLNTGWLTGDGEDRDGIYVAADGTVGIKVIPSAKLHLPANTSTVTGVPLKFNTTGSVLTTVPEPGSIEVKGNYIFYTDSSGVRHSFVLDGVAAISRDVSVNTSIPTNTSFAIPFESALLSSSVFTVVGDSIVTVNLSGVYEIDFTGTMQMTSGTAKTTTIDIVVNDSVVGYTRNAHIDTHPTTVGNMKILELDAGDEIKIKVAAIDLSGGAMQIDVGSTIVIKKLQ